MKYKIVGIVGIVGMLSHAVFSATAYSGQDGPPGMILIPEGKFLMGSRGKMQHGHDGGDGRVGIEVGVDEIPRHERYLKAFYIDKFEVTAGDYRKFSAATGRPLPGLMTNVEKDWRGKVNYPPIEDNFPVNDIAFPDAEAYCKWAGKRLPTEEEWEKAARGDDGRIWPWGNRFEVGMANTIEWSKDEVAAVAVGSFSTDVSPYGVYDMAGNVSEWTSSWYDAYPGSSLKRPLFGKKNKVIKGGAWMGPFTPFSRAANRNTAGISKENHHPHFGVRCAKDM